MKMDTLAEAVKHILADILATKTKNLFIPYHTNIRGKEIFLLHQIRHDKLFPLTSIKMKTKEPSLFHQFLPKKIQDYPVPEYYPKSVLSSTHQLKPK